MTAEEIKEILSSEQKSTAFVDSAFKSFDKDGSGSIDKEELKGYIASAFLPLTDSDKKRDALLAEFDKNTDGKLSLVEFSVMIREFLSHLSS